MIFRISRRFGLADVRLVALTLTLPLLLLRPDLLPVLVARGGVDVRPSDLGIAVLIGLFAFSASDGRLRAIRGWLWFAPFLGLLLFSALFAPNSGTVLVAVLKLLEYFAFGVVVTLAICEERAARVILVLVVAWAAFAGATGFAELLRAHRFGRAPSLMGVDPLGLLGAVVLITAIAAPRTIGSATVRKVGIMSALLCLLISGSLSALVGLGLGMVVALARGLVSISRFSRVYLAALTAMIIALAGTFVALRWTDIRAATQVGNGSPAHTIPGGSFTQRLMFADFGFRMWLDHPILGIGFQQASRLSNWGPYFASVRADFPALPPTYFPTIPEVSFGQPTNTTELSLHNVYSQLLAETGVVGLILFFVGFAGASRLSFRRLKTSEIARTGALLVVVVLGALTRNQLYGGLPETALLVIGVAFAVAGGRSTVSGPVHA